MKFKEDKVFDYKLDKKAASIFGNDIAEIEWNIKDNDEVIVTQFINNEYHTPIMDHDHFYLSDRKLYNDIVNYIKENFVNKQ